MLQIHVICVISVSYSSWIFSTICEICSSKICPCSGANVSGTVTRTCTMISNKARTYDSECKLAVIVTHKMLFFKVKISNLSPFCPPSGQVDAYRTPKDARQTNKGSHSSLAGGQNVTRRAPLVFNWGATWPQQVQPPGQTTPWLWWGHQGPGAQGGYRSPLCGSWQTQGTMSAMTRMRGLLVAFWQHTGGDCLLRHEAVSLAPYVKFRSSGKWTQHFWVNSAVNVSLSILSCEEVCPLLGFLPIK